MIKTRRYREGVESTDAGGRRRSPGYRTAIRSRASESRGSASSSIFIEVSTTSICIELAASTPSSLRLAALSTFDPSSFSSTIRFSLSTSVILSISFSFPPPLSLSLYFSLSLLTRWLRRPCRTLNLSPRNSLILSTVPTSRLQGPFPTSAFSCFQLFSRGFCTHSCNNTFILDHARIDDDEIVADEQLSSMT